MLVSSFMLRLLNFSASSVPSRARQLARGCALQVRAGVLDSWCDHRGYQQGTGVVSPSLCTCDTFRVSLEKNQLPFGALATRCLFWNRFNG